MSDSTGNLAHHMLAASLTQFPHEGFEIRSHMFLRTPEAMASALQVAANEGGVVMHAVVSAEAKQQIFDFCRNHKLHCKDLTGDFVEFLAVASGYTPSAKWQDLHKVDEAYHRKIQAVEFTLAHDDGLGLDTLHEADIILVGISRTSKTPTSIYLSQLGYQTANIALAMGIDPPRELVEIPPGKTVGLMIDSTRLIDIRRRRQMEWKMASGSYDDPAIVRDELIWSRRLFNKNHWPVIDVTNNAIEETAGRILDVLKLPRTAGA